MTEGQTRHQSAKIDKLIAFFKLMKKENPGAGQLVYSPIDQENHSMWNQTEAEYQADQARWLADIDARKQAKKESDN